MDQTIKYYNTLLVYSGKILIILQIVPLILGFLKWKHFNKPIKVFWTFCFVYFLLDIFVQILVWLLSNYYDFFKPIVLKFQIKDFSFINILYYMNNFSLLGYFFVLVLKPNRISDWIKWVSIFLFFTSIINYLFIEGYNVVGVFNPTSDALFCFILPSIFMWYLFTQDGKVPIAKNPYFWINLRLIIPNLVALILQFYGNKIQSTDTILFLKISLAKNAIWILGLIFLTIGFYYARYTKYLPQKTTIPLPPQ